jgi:hypothetical protein
MNMNDEFDEAGFKTVVDRHWQHHGRCEHQYWSFFQRDDGAWQIEIAPIYQEILGGKNDGMKVWTGFEINLSDFLAEPGFDGIEFGAVSFCIECNAAPMICIRGKFQGQPFVMKLSLEPDPDSDPLEIIDTLKQEVRAIERDEP